MNSILDRVLNTLESGGVTRYHANPYVKAQTDAEHSWGVAIILTYLGGAIAPSNSLLLEGLLHDTGEIEVGDIPFSTKKKNHKLRTIVNQLEADARRDYMLEGLPVDDWEQAQVKIADCLEALWWCAHNSNFPRGSHPMIAAYQKQFRALRETYNGCLPTDVEDRALSLFSSLIHVMGGR
jgi:5'-deoxynucleotidase YfbR-like HD superfamily hydrolase